jgi:hypothetical protein
MLFNYCLYGLDATQAGVTKMARAPGFNGAGFCPVWAKFTLTAASNGLAPIVPPTLALSTSGNGNVAADVAKLAALPAIFINVGYDYIVPILIAKHGIGGDIYVKVGTPAVASTYLLNVVVVGTAC